MGVGGRRPPISQNSLPTDFTDDKEGTTVCTIRLFNLCNLWASVVVIRGRQFFNDARRPPSTDFSEPGTIRSQPQMWSFACHLTRRMSAGTTALMGAVSRCANSSKRSGENSETIVILRPFIRLPHCCDGGRS